MNGADTAQARPPQLAANLLRFCRGLRAAGLIIGTGQVLEAVDGLLAAGLARRDDVRIALRASLVSNPRHFRLFERLFEQCFGQVDTPLDGIPAAAVVEDRWLPAGHQPASGAAAREQDGGRYSAGTASSREVLAGKDFAQMTAAELDLAQQLLRDGTVLPDPVTTRRFSAAGRRERVDPRGSMRRMLRDGGDLIRLAYKERRKRPPVIVMLCDISGSMSQYSRAFLFFAHALARAGRQVHTFAFGTRLTNVSRRLRQADTNLALAQVASDVRDWDGGTRIAACLRRFNGDWGRRVLAGKATVILLSDGLERDPDAGLALQMQRLRHTCRQLIWINPMLRYEQFEPLAAGIREMLPHVDRFLPAHNVNSLLALCQLPGLRGPRLPAPVPSRRP